MASSFAISFHQPKDSRVNWHKQLRQKLVNIILDIRVKESIASFLDGELGDPAAVPLPDRVKNKRERNAKPTSIKKWSDLDLEGLVAVVDDQFSNRIQNRPLELKTCLRYMRHVRDYACHVEGEPNIPEMIKYTSILHTFLDFIDATEEVRKEIVELEKELLTARSHEFGIGGATDSGEAASEHRRELFHVVGSDPFAKFVRLLADHEEFIGRSKFIKSIHAFVLERESGTLILEAEPGTGKSALIAHCIRHEFKATTPRPAYYLYHCGEGLTDPTNCLRTLYEQLVDIHGIKEAVALEAVENSRDLSAKFHRLLTKHVAPQLGENTQIILIDSLDEASTGTELTAYQALPDQLPNGIVVIASTRAIPERIKVLARRRHIQRLDLNLPDFDFDNLNDARDFVADRLKEQSVGSSIQDEICRLGAGNFLVLREICRWVREKLLPEDRTGFLKRLAAEPDGPLRAIYDEFWGRISKANLDAASKVAGLILETQGPANDALALESGVVGRSDWEAGIEHLAEYLKKIDGNDGRVSYRVYHQSFADFLRTRVDPEAQQARQRLANMCLRWRELSGELREYAVEFGPTHLCRAERWADLEALLTDLEFVEEKCKQQMVRKLAKDYQLTRQYHPGWSRAIVDELRHEETLSRWAADVMKEGMRWRGELNRKWESDPRDLVELTPRYRFSTPPDTSELCDRIMNESPTVEEQFNPAITTLQILRSFVTCLADRLARHPKATLSFALNYHAVLAEQAERLLRSRHVSWFEEYPRRRVDPREIPLPTLRVDASSFAVSANGKWCVTGENDGTLRLWDLLTGKAVDDNTLAHVCSVTHIVISVDGTRSISFGSDGSAATHELRSGRWDSHGWERHLPPVTAAACSPEASVVVVAGDDDKVRLLDGQSGEPLCDTVFSDDELCRITNVHLIPERFEIRVGDKTGNVAVWDLCSQKLIGRMTADPIPDDEDFEPHGWLNSYLPVSMFQGPHGCEPREPIGSKLGQFWNRGLVSADGLIEIMNDLTDLDQNQLYCSGNPIACVEGNPSVLQLAADGRVLWMNCGNWIEGCDVTKISKFVTGPKERYDRPIRHDPSRFDIAFDLSASPDDETETTNFTIVISAHGPGSEEDVTDDGERKESEDDAETSAAITADGCIAIRVVDAEELESDDDEECQFQDLLLHSIHVPVDPDDSSTCSFYIRVSPNGQRAFVAISPDTQPARWFLWDIRKRKKVIPHVYACWAFVDVTPDWKSVVTIEDEMVMICDLETGERLRRLPVSGATAITSDGRNLVDYTDDGVSVWPLAKSQPSPILLNCPGLRRAVVSPDGKLLVCSFDDCLRVYDLDSGMQLVDQPFRYVNRGNSWNAWRQNSRMDFDGRIFDMSTRSAGWDPPLMLRNLPQYAEEEMTPLVTATRVFRYRLDVAELQRMLADGGPVPSDYELPGEFDAKLTTVCPKCGNRFSVPDRVERAIDELLRSSGIAPDQSPCLSLPDSAWQDPALQCQCTHIHCQQSLRLNPFIA